MYQSFYGLRELPFELTADPRFLFLSDRHREALSALEYGLSCAKAITVLVGEAGTGKTTLLQAALRSERCRRVEVVQVSNPSLTRPEFIELLARRFALSARAAESKTALLSELEHVLRERRDRGDIVALVIDEAQSLSVELLEEIRLLANIETPAEKLLPLVLAGQPELRDRLNDRSLRQLKQRVTLRCETGAFTLAETTAYIAARLLTAGGDSRPLFTREAIALVHECARGIPRVINVICDNALLTGFGAGRKQIDPALVREVTRDFDLAPADPGSSDDVSLAAGADRADGRTGIPAELRSINERSIPADRGAAAPHEAPGQSNAVEPPMFATATRSRRFSFFGAR